MSQKYVILQEDTVHELINKVNDGLERGGVLIGGIIFDKVNRPTQAMIYNTGPAAKLLQKKEKKSAT